VCRLAQPRNKPPVSSFSTSTDGLQGLTKTFGLLPLRLCEQTGRVLQAIPSGPGNLSPGKRAEIGGEISHADEAADRGEYRQAAGVVAETLILFKMNGPTGNVASNAGRASGPGAILHLKAKALGPHGATTDQKRFYRKSPNCAANVVA